MTKFLRLKVSKVMGGPVLFSISILPFIFLNLFMCATDVLL